MSQSIVNQFNDFEKEENLFQLKVDNILIWDYIRFDVFKAIKQSKSKSDFTAKTTEQKSFVVILDIIKQIFFVLLHPKFFRIKEKKDILVLGHPRRQKEGRFYKDIYTDDIVNTLSETNNVLTLELPNDDGHYRPINIPEIKYLDNIILKQGFAQYFCSSKFSFEEIEGLKNIEINIKNTFDCDINIQRLIRRATIKYKSSYKRIEKIVTTISPKLIMAVNAYNFNNKMFMEIANKHEIKTIELQHGSFGSEHIVYNYAKGINPVSFPKEFFAWGEYWHQNASFPQNTAFYNVGFPFMNDKQAKQNKAQAQEQNNVLVASQWTIGLELMTYINDFAKQAKEYNFIVKLHPLEFDSLDKYIVLSEHDNISFITTEKSIYDLFAICKTQIGVYSTTLVEGLAYNLRTMIIPLEGYKTYSDLIEKGQFYKISTAADFNNSIKTDIKHIDTENIWVTGALDNIGKLVQ